MTVIVTGGMGPIGNRVVAALAEQGRRVVAVTRRPPAAALDHPAPAPAACNVAGPPGDYISHVDFYGLIREVAQWPGTARFTGRSQCELRVAIDSMTADLGYSPAGPSRTRCATSLRRMAAAFDFALLLRHREERSDEAIHDAWIAAPPSGARNDGSGGRRGTRRTDELRRPL